MTETCKTPQKSSNIPVRDAGLDASERAVLLVARCFFQSFAVPDRHMWMLGLQEAACQFTGPGGLATLYQVLAAVQAMRRSRASIFTFNNPSCACCSTMLTQHERQFMGALTGLRSGRRSEAETHAMVLCEGNPSAELIHEMEILAKLLDPRARSIRMPRMLPQAH